VSFETRDGSATAGSDYTAKTGKVSIRAGAVSAKITIPIIGDTAGEGNQTFAVKLTDTGASGIPIEQDTGVGTIIDDDNPVLVGAGIGDAAVVEGDTGAKAVSLTVTLSSSISATTIVKYHTLDGTATAGGDYLARSGSVSIAGGKTSGTIMIMVNGDTSVENDEAFSVVIDSAGTFSIDRSTGTIRIVDDD